MNKWALLLLIALVVLVGVSALAVVQQRHASRSLFTDLQRAEKQREALDIDWGRLQLEYSTLADMSRIERIARTQLDMRSPVLAEIMVMSVAETKEGDDD